MARKTLPANKARQARWGLPVLFVLIGALVLAAIAWAGAELYGETIDASVRDQASIDVAE